MKNILTKMLTALVIICCVICTNITIPSSKEKNVQATTSDSKDFKLHVIKCEGSSTLIDAGGQYVLVDGGKDKNTVADYLYRNCKKKNNKVVLEAIILTHNHNDHIEGILTILNDTNRFKVSKIYMEDIYKEGSGYKTSLPAAIKKQGATKISMVTAEQKAKKMIYHPKTKVGELQVNGVVFRIYPPVDDFVNSNKIDYLGSAHQEGYRMNEASLVVKVVGHSRSALLMGDAYDFGFASLCNRYGVNEFKSDFCVMAHHGLRSYNITKGEKYKTLSNLSNLSEIDIYNQYINAKHYVFATTLKELKSDSKYVEHKNEFKNNLKYNKEKSKCYFTFKGSTHFNSANGNVKGGTD